MKTKLVTIVTTFLFLVGCQDQGQQLKDKTTIEQEAALQAENANLQRRVGEMEADLSVRHDFYQATKGVYEGTIQANEEEFSIRVTLAPSLPPMRSTRTRTLAEVEFDLTNLSFNIQVVQWKAGLPSSAVGCRVQGVRPDLATREMTIASQDCPNLYRVSFGGNDLRGFVQPTTNANVFSFHAVKTDDATRRKP